MLTIIGNADKIYTKHARLGKFPSRVHFILLSQSYIACYASSYISATPKLYYIYRDFPVRENITADRQYHSPIGEYHLPQAVNITFFQNTVHLKSTYYAEAVAVQVTPSKQPYGTRVFPFSAAVFLL